MSTVTATISGSLKRIVLLKKNIAHGPLSKHANLVGAESDGMNIYSNSGQNIDEWLIAAPGYVTYLDGDHIWVSHLAASNTLPIKHMAHRKIPQCCWYR